MGQADAPRTGFRRSATLFRIAGIEVRLDFSWFLVFALIVVSLSLGYFPRLHPDLPAASSWAAGTLAALLFFASILAHELGHALVARLSGIRVPAITLFVFGGVSHMEEEARSPAAEFRIAVVGPLTSFALAGAFAAVHAALPEGTSPLFATVIQYLAWVNLALGAFNLLPGLPLDGGRVLRAAAWWRTGSLRQATRVASNAGKGLAIALMLLGGIEIFAGGLVGGLWLVLIGMFLRSTAEAGYQGLLLRQTLGHARVDDVASHDPVTVPPQLTLDRLVNDYFLGRGYAAYPVVEGGAVLGLVSVREVRQVPAERRASTTVKECMHPLADGLQVTPDTPLDEALEKLAAAPSGRLVVLRRGELTGMLTRSDMARFLEIRSALAEDEPPPG